MAYDASRVDFTPEEHQIAASLDNVIEQFADGFQFEDVAAIMAAKPVLEFIAAGGDRLKAAKRLATLALMLERDNEWLASDEDTPSA